MSLRITTDKTAINFDRLMAWLRDSYWAGVRTDEVQRRAIEGALCFIAVDGDEFVGFCRVVTDGATFGWICDVMVDPERRGAGIGKALMSAVMAHPPFQGMRMVLATRDAHELYRKFGFTELGFPQNWMAVGFRTCETPD